MNPMILAYIITVPVFLAIDMIWLLGIGRSFYVSEIGGLLRANPNLPAAGVFYLLYGLGLAFFAISSAVSAGSAAQAFMQGAFFGLIAYGTYDLTNLAVVNGFTLKIALIDMAWGALLSGMVAWVVTRICIAAL